MSIPTYSAITQNAIEDLAALGVPDAHELADLAVELIITALMQDPAIPPRSFSEWWARFANMRTRLVEHFHRRIGGHVAIEDVLRTLEFEGAL
jgi:hypothetical protein